MQTGQLLENTGKPSGIRAELKKRKKEEEAEQRFKDLYDSQLHLIHPARQRDSEEDTSPFGSSKSSHPHVFSLPLSLFFRSYSTFVYIYIAEVVLPGGL